ncbi:Zinc/iron permease [Dacryopinax primogenitus]|uniref:Zinc/iron permease n=1 Tax=Dacryopinax primogenitus (strain DJM 731) TaxID=1858805 RepID=M5G3R5_DACPD|nr:Zinc/iron permease [Dacryopinax primogenitus]EJU04886.1 Zinc/iron permease [Dacryopinax primogenitus]
MLTLKSATSRAALLAVVVVAFAVHAVASPTDFLGSVTSDEIDKCSAAVTLTAVKHQAAGTQSNVIHQVFAFLFPFESPGWNSVLATFYISSVPNFILAFIPAEISPSTLNVMSAFATGGLLSDVMLHLVPHSFMGEHTDDGVHLLMIEERRNILIGLAMFCGFAFFFIMEKSLRTLSGEDDDDHGHGHGHSHSHAYGPEHKVDSAGSTAVRQNGEGLRPRKKGQKATEPEGKEPAVHATSKLSAYLNILGDFIHNIMAASFYSSPLIGATTALACFAHEIPHEMADYTILVRSGFSKRQAMMSQFGTAVGAFVGTFIGIAIHNAASVGADTKMDLAAALRGEGAGLLGTSAQPADLVIPFVAGGFLYIGAVSVVPTLLKGASTPTQTLKEFGAMAFGVFCMFLVAWNE